MILIPRAVFIPGAISLAAIACAFAAPAPRAVALKQEPTSAQLALFSRYVEALRAD